MLHSYAFSNFQSFRERVEVDLSISRKVTMTEWMTEAATGERVSKLMAVIGPNGSGKTALLKPMVFISWFIANSFQNPPDAGIPVTPHAAAVNEPTELECMLDFDGKLWRYVLRCTPERVLHEALYQKRERFGYVFLRDWDAAANSYVVKQQDFGLAPPEARKVRPNVSLIAWAAQFGVPLAMRMTAPYVNSNVNVLGRVQIGNQDVQNAAQHFSAHPEQRKRMEQLLSAWDLGLSGVELVELSVSNPQVPDQKIWVPFGRHKNKTAEFKLPFALESSGTQGAFVLLSRLLQTLEIGGLAVIDEFENDLHPHMLEPILDLFANPSTNPHQAQLLFTCHAIEVLNLVHKSQVMLVQKNEDCESTASRMDAVEGIRNDDNYYAKYMAGAYGAVPIF
ncbi:MAG: abortive infection protein [Gallionellales bacterium RIFCSPLOWO2_12_FULL_57_18]|nr:MAG: abortive infection protein [Gallionellales bacterium RIFCSPLOWO2_02_FULL_57_47]OGS94812.1 MAG: abortive infection protein [Gallionellales bacterium RIFCSPLOWO2_12_FULL_57_18]OGT09118.1 MAG: abortive infection protein [Gallionellales bacterium RIFCSPHIGHO2_02_FULL_57_16]